MKPTWQSDCGRVTLHCGDCTELLRTLPDASVDCCITDPPYPEISRDYGRMTEPQWHAMMDVVVPEVRRVLKPAGSAVFILQPNSERVGRMRPWLWEFMAKWTREWGMVQDAWWWNVTTIPSRWCHEGVGLTRQSLKACVWLGPEDCFRDQSEVLLEPGDWIRAAQRTQKMRRYSPSGFGVNESRCAELTLARGGATPFNVLPIPNANSTTSAGANGHSAGTPEPLCDWWLRYICPPGGTVLDPFIGSGTVGLAAVKRGCKVVGMEKMPKYYETSCERIGAELSKDRQLELIA